MSLSLRFASLAIGLLLAAVLIFNYLFDQERIDAFDAREQEQMRHHAERAAEILAQAIELLRSDALFLSHTPIAMEIRTALEMRPRPPLDEDIVRRIYQNQVTIFSAFAAARPEYLQLRLIGIQNGGRELMRIERHGQEVITVQADDLQSKDSLYQVQQAQDIQAGEVLLSRIDLNRENGSINLPETAVLHAVTPMTDDKGTIFALVVVHLNMSLVFSRMQEFLPDSSQLYLLDQEGYFLIHPDMQKTIAFDRPEAYRLADEFPRFAAAIAELHTEDGYRFHANSDDAISVIAATQSYDVSPGQSRQLTLLLSEPTHAAQQQISAARRNSYLMIFLLMGVAILLITLISRRLTHSLRQLVDVARSVTQGDFNVAMPTVPGRDLESLTVALQHMITTIKAREEQLKALNLTLESQVSQRTGELDASRAELAKEQLMLQSILDHVGDGVVAIDGKGQIILWNRRAEEMLGMGPAELPSQALSSHYGLYRAPDGELIPIDELPLSRALRGETVRNQELFVRNDCNHTGCWISAFARPLTHISEEREGAVAVLVDITQERKLREQLDSKSGELAKIGRLTLIAQIVDTMAHRLSQPLAAIANYAGAAIQLQAARKLDDERLHEVLDLISRQAERGGECLRDLRNLRLRGSPPQGKLDINDIVESALQLLEDRLHRFNIQIERQLTPDLPKLVGQDIELQQAVVHLLMNAIDSLSATNGQSKIIRLSTTCQPSSGLLQITVCDNGPGVAPELREQIFEAWFSTKADALGLGLAVAKSISENHNGSLSLLDTAEGMTCFLIELPAMLEEPI